MSLTSKTTADASTSAAVKAAQRARAASSLAVASAQNAAQNAAIAAQNAAAIAANAAQNASGAAQSAASGMSKGVSGGVYTARNWAAPRLESAADYCTTTVAPRVSSALRTTARQVRPVDTSSPKRSSVLTWSILGAAILAALGAAAAMVRYRYRSAIAADSEGAADEAFEDSTGSQTAPGNPDETRSGITAEDQGSETSVNGRVTSSGW